MRQEMFFVGSYLNGQPYADISDVVQAFESGGRFVGQIPVSSWNSFNGSLVILEFDGEGSNLFHQKEFDPRFIRTSKEDGVQAE